MQMGPKRRRPSPGAPPFRFFNVQPGRIGPPGLPGLPGPKPRPGLGDYPLVDGAPGNFVWPYDETGVWGAGGPPGGGLTPQPTDPNLPASAPSPSNGPWSNPDTFATVGITAATSTSVPVLTGNALRRALIIQNNSTAVFPDTTPVMYVGFNSVALVGVSLGLAAGLGILFDVRCPRDSIYITFGPFTDGGATTVVQGAVVQAIYSP